LSKLDSLNQLELKRGLVTKFSKFFSSNFSVIWPVSQP